MSYTGLFFGNNKFTPPFLPAYLSSLTPYIDVSTGLPPNNVYVFRGTRFTQPSQPNYIDRFLLMEKGNAEIKQIYLGLSNFESKYYFAPHGGFLRYYHYNSSMRVFFNDGAGGGEIEIVSCECSSNSWSQWISFQLDLDNEKAVAVHWQLRNSDAEYGEASLFSGNSLSEDGKHKLYNLLLDATIPPDPYEDHNNNYDRSIGGKGNYDETSDTIAEGTLPTVGGNTSGFCTAYVPDLQQINALANRLADPTVYQVLGNTILKVDDIIIGLSIFPFNVPKITATHQLRINLVGVYVPSGLYIDKADGQYHEIDCGSLDVEEYWGNCLDYNPYTKVSIYLPFCGFYELDTDDVMNKTIQVKYRVDIMTGTCLASIIVDGSVMYQYAGQCSSQIPISSVSFDSFMQSIISVGVATATGGAGLAAAGASAALGDARANMAGMAHADVSQYQHESVRANFNKTVVDTQSSIQSATAGAIMSAKGQYKHAGAMTGIAGFMGVKKPYLIIKRPNQAIPSDYGKFHGYPSNTKAVLGDLQGFTVVDDIRLNIPDATVEEIIECEKLLKGGIII